MSIKTLIVERDDAALHKLATVVGLEDDFELVGAHSSISPAAGALARSAADVLFLDCELPLAECWDALAGPIRRRTAVCVLLGAAENYSTSGLALPPLDYLQRPIRLAQLAASLERIRRWAQDPSASAPCCEASQLLDGRRLMLQRGGSVLFIALADIEFLKAASNYLKIYVADQSYRFRETIGHIQARLPPQFVRIHRSYIVNSRSIVEFAADGSGGYLVRLRNGKHLPVGPTYAAGLREQLACSFIPAFPAPIPTM